MRTPAVAAGPHAVKLLVVDDSALMRKLLRDLFVAQGQYEVQTARDGADALAQIEVFDPDVVTLDVNMPEMDGLTCLSHIMTRFPRPVLMVSSLTAKGAQATMESLALGAIDFVEKPGGTVTLDLAAVRGELLRKVEAAKRARPRMARAIAAATRKRIESMPKARPAKSSRVVEGLVLVGVSTGGPRTLEDILPALPAHFHWPVVIAQHMPAGFTAAFASRLDKLCALTVCEAGASQPLAPGHVYIGRGGSDIVIERALGRLVVKSVNADERLLWHPSVDRLVDSAMKALEPRALIGVELTGMGDDGARAMTDLVKAGGRSIAEDSSTAIVFGMPGDLIRRGGASKVLPSDRVADQLVTWVL
jgi:two-component system, chemotaxis family, protein-glutamate methylesterase/glutaminase